MFSCICPHVGEELWSLLGHDDTIAFEAWPVYDEAVLKEDEIEIAVQVNGKVKAKLMVPADADEAAVKELVHANETVAALTDGKNIVKELYVKGRLYNMVIK